MIRLLPSPALCLLLMAVCFMPLSHIAQGQSSGASTAATGQNTTAETAGPYRGYTAPQYKDVVVESLYIKMRDGVQIAVDLVLPKGLPAGAKIPTIVETTRYWRAREGRGANDYQKFFASYGYALVWVDARGTGASTGSWLMPWSRDEARDGGEIIDWIIRQPWSNGKVGAFGNSYGGNAALHLASINHKALKAVIPRHYEFDEYTDVPFPGGIFNDWGVRVWNEGNHQLDLTAGVKPVDADRDKSILREAISAHARNIELYKAAQQVTFRDDRPFSNVSIDDFSIHSLRREIERSRAAINNWGGWLDAGTADAVIKSFMNFKNPQRSIIGAWNHGGGQNASPYFSAQSETLTQRLEWLRFFDFYLKGVDTGVMPEEHALFYYTMGEEKWKKTNTWPLAETTHVRWYMNDNHALAQSKPDAAAASDRYTVDFETTTGQQNRWTTQLGGPVNYPDRAVEDRRLLTYTSAPLNEDVEITGHPVINLYITSTTSDGAFFVYLEDVDQEGKVTYITEGQLRAIHRKVSGENAPYASPVPYHSFKRKDAGALVPGEVTELSFGLLPTSVLIRQGHRIRIAIAGHDKSVFARIPADETPVITVERNRQHASYIDLPVIKRSSTPVSPVNLLITKPVSATRPTASASPTAQPNVAADPTVEQILNRYAEAVGGREAVERVITRVSKGTKENTDGSMVEIEVYEKIPNKRLSIASSPKGRLRLGYNGSIGWAETQGNAARRIETAEGRLPANFVRLHRETSLNVQYRALTFKGRARVGEREAYVLEGTTADGNLHRLYFDAQTGLLVRRDGKVQVFTRNNTTGKEELIAVELETYYEDYREVDGVKLPFVVQDKTPSGSLITRYTEIKNNISLEDALFEMPGAR